MEAAEELEFELEALRATYGDDRIEVQELPAAGSAAGAAGLQVAVAVAPRTDSLAEHDQYVVGCLVMTVGPSYPSQPPYVQLADAKGLDDARLAGLQAALASEAADMAGELQLGHLCETAIDLLTESNHPEGACAFCLEPLLSAAAQGGGGGAGGAAAAGGVLRLGCYHCYHMACFAPWWQWQQRRLAEREQQLLEEYKSMAPLKLEEEGIRREQQQQHCSSFGGSAAGSGEGGGSGSGGSGSSSGAFVLSCPACRAEVAPSSLAHAWQQLQAVTADSWSSSGGGGGSSRGRAALQELSPQQRQQLQDMQRRHAAVMRRQQACGGLVDASHSVSLSDLQQAAAAAAAAQQAAAAHQQQAAEAEPAAAGQGSSGGGRGQQRSGRGPGGRGRGQPQEQRRPVGGSVSSGGRHAGGGRGRGGGRRGDHPAGEPKPVPAGPGSRAAPEAVMAGLSLGEGTPQQQRHPRPPAQQQQQDRPQQRRGPGGGRHRGGGRGGGRGAAATAAPPPAAGGS